MKQPEDNIIDNSCTSDNTCTIDNICTSDNTCTSDNSCISEESSLAQSDEMTDQTLQSNADTEPSDINSDGEIIDSAEIFERDFDSIKTKYPFIAQTHVIQFGDEFLALMAQGGIDAVRAYEITHTDDIVTHRTKEAIRKAYSKSHLRQIKGGADMTAEVPRDVYNQYKRLMPELSDGEIRKHYISSLKD